jgi:hypothetical protein
VVLISLLLVFGGAGFLLFRWFRRQPRARSAWKTAILLGLGLGLTRATLACFGWYVVEHTGGPAQVPAFALAMLAWPEGALLPSTGPGLTPVSTYVSLFVLLVVSSMVLVAAIAAAARRGRVQA